MVNINTMADLKDAQEDLINNTGTWKSTTEEVDIPSLARENPYFQAAFALNKYYSPLIIIFGLVGNTLSLLVMTQVRKFIFIDCAAGRYRRSTFKC